MKPTLASTQESVLEELMQSSFGAQYLYIPNRYQRGSGNDEPCDLLWFGNGTLLLFYMTSGKKSIEKQDEHNLKQARKWRRYWSACPSQPLTGTNRYGDTLEVRANEINLLVSISIVSHKAGIVFHPHKDRYKDGLTCTIPESLIHFIAGIHGTIIDLLQVLFHYSKNLRRHIVRHSLGGPDRLESLMKRHARETFNVLEPQRIDVNHNAADFDFVYKILNLNRLSAPLGQKLISNQCGREQIAAYFCDLSARDFLVIAKCASSAIIRTENGKLSITGMTQGLHLDWVVFATSFRAKNVVELFNGMQDSLLSMGKNDLPIIIFGWDFDFAEYRSPSMYCLPLRQQPAQAEVLVRGILERIRRFPI